MEINDLILPSAFIQDIRAERFHREIGCWELKEDFDAFGNFLETEIGDVYKTTESLLLKTGDLWKYFVSEASDEESNEWESEPSYISYISDFSKIICFAAGGDGSPFCFDFRDDVENPTIIWWADAYWLRIAPNYESFIALFDFSKH